MHPNAFVLRSALGPIRALEGDLSLVVVAYRYSMSSDRALTEEATWKGRIPGRSLATVMSELRRLPRAPRNFPPSTTDCPPAPEPAPGRAASGAVPGGRPCPTPAAPPLRDEHFHHPHRMATRVRSGRQDARARSRS